jgi:transglutaminase-like putative cysteine protease/tetratricopeptide (TPR) repeat protein
LSSASVVMGAEALGQRAPAATPIAASAGPTRRPTPEARLDERVQEALAHRRDNHGAIAILRAWEQRDWVSPWRMVDRLHGIAAAAGISAENAAIARVFEARARRRVGQRREAEQLAQSLGFATRWIVAGALDNEGRAGFALETEPEAQRYRAIDMNASFAGKERPARWRALPELSVLGMVPVGASVRPEQNVCAIAHTTAIVRGRSAVDATLWFGAGGQSKVYVNGAAVLTDDVARERPFPDRHGARVRLRPGANRVLVKVCVVTEPLAFFARITGANGAPIDLAYDSDPTVALALEAPTAPVVVAPSVGLLSSLQTRAQSDRATPDEIEDYARWLSGTGADPSAEDTAADLALRAAERGPSVSRWLLAADLRRGRNNRLHAIQQAIDLDPSDPLPLLALAHERRIGVRPEDALPLIDRVLAANPNDVTARVERALVLDGTGLNLAARAELERAANVAPHAAALLEVRASMAERARLTDESIALRRALSDLRDDDANLHRELASDARVRGDRAELRREAEAALAAAPYDTALYGTVAELYESAGERDAALAVLHRALDIAPDAAELWRAQGEMQIRMNLRDDARTSMRRALALRPQDRSLRQHIETLEPAVPRPDEALAEAPATFLRRRTPERSRSADEYRMRSLHELTVRTVFANGLSGTFRQMVFEVLTSEGAQQYRQIPVGFDQDTQRFELRAARVYHRDGSVDESTGLEEYTVSGGASRMYYDTREMVVSFPRLQVGDVVEVKYRVDDVAQRNAFADYFGDLEIFQSDTPRASVRYVLRAPTGRTFYFRAPELRGLERNEREESPSVHVYDFAARDVAPVAPEENAPGVTERAAYLHVSTYRTWEEVGRWYWGLIAEQLRADDRVRAIAQRVTRGMTEPRDKVRAIYNWVIQNTRYVALEFGIHGFKPYRVADICQRGFGDCKDKASTIVTMLREVGVDASIVLVRTRRNGDIDPSPASLAVFDHAIAYVPAMTGYPDGLFLDGTAQNSAMDELPSMDQGAMGLVVNQRGEGRLVHLPFVQSANNRVEIRTELDVNATGGGRLRASHELRGPDAGSLRAAMEAQATRVERIERWLAGAYPGSRVSNVRTGDLRDVDLPARLEYDAELPSIGTRQGETLRFTPTPSPELTSNYGERSSRTSDVMLPGPLAVHDRRVVRLPAGSTVSELPPAATVRTAWVSLEYTVQHTGTTITVERTLTYHVDRVAVRDYQAFRDACQRIDEALGRRVTARLPATAGRAP